MLFFGWVTCVMVIVVTATPTTTKSNNRQRHTSNDNAQDVTSHFKTYGDSPMGCKELRSKRYLSDGTCTSVKPITEVVCAGICLPVSKLPWYSDYVNLWYSKRHQGSGGGSQSHSRADHSADSELSVWEEPWQCVDDVVKRKRVNLLCQDGQMRSYVIKTVRSCKCKKRKRGQNDVNKH